MALPSTETEDWRYSPIGDLPLHDLQPVLEAPKRVELRTRVDAVLAPGSRAATVSVIDGFVVDISVDEGWASKGLDITFDDQRAASPGDGEPTVFDELHKAFSPGAAVIKITDGLVVDQPIVVVNHHATAGAAGFPHVVVEAGENSESSIVEWQSSIEGGSLSAPVVEIDVAAAGRVNYLTVQVTGDDFWALARQRSSVGSQATLTTGIAAFGGRYARTRTDSRLVGRGSSANLITAYYGDGNQIQDFRTFQHHDARDTRSDLLFKGAQDDQSGAIYTGMIHIHPDGAGSNAFQTNRNIKLSEDAWAWSVPNLEIENNDVRCAHASTVSPVDDDQRFYLGARGVPPGPADRLIVAGFFNEVIARMPVSAVRPELRSMIAAKLDHRKVEQ
jgi:Fe-S cluster assembly protein SufD